MQVNSFPKWFIRLTNDPSTLSEKFIKKFRKKTSLDDSLFNDFIEIFGRMNQQQLASCFPPPLAEKIQAKLKMRTDRFHRLLTLALNDLLEGRHLNLESLNALYAFSVFSPDTIQESVIREMAHHILSLPMPAQEARRWQCYSIPAIQRAIDAQREEMDRTLTILFQATLLKEAASLPLSLNMKQERDLFKYGALKGHGKILSWGHLLFSWARLVKGGKKIQEELGTSFRFDKLLIPPLRQLPEPSHLISLSFHEFAIGRAINLLFHHPQTRLPSIPSIKEELAALFSASLEAQQNALYFVDHLHTAIQKIDQGEEFPFDEMLKLLNALVPDRSDAIYPFLHTCLHYFHCLVKFSVDQSQAAFLFAAIHSLEEEEKRRYQKWVSEGFLRAPFKISPAFIQYASRLPLKETAHIILRFSKTQVVSDDDPPLASPYLTSEEHLRILQQIEETFGLSLPVPVIADFLFFQTANASVFEILDAYADVRASVIKYSDKLAIPSLAYQSWEQEANHFIGAIQLMPREVGSVGQKRLGFYMERMLNMVFLLQFAAYPKPVSSFYNFIPCSIEDNNLLFKNENFPIHNCLDPILSCFPNGPARFCHWSCHPEAGEMRFSVSVLNSLQNLQAAYTFHLPLRIPLASSLTSPFFRLLQAFIDTFAEEAISEKEEENMREVTDKPYHLPDECLEREGNPAEIFDACLAAHPLLTNLWQKNEGLFGADMPLVKTELYTFIKNLRFSFKASVFLALNGPDFSVADMPLKQAAPLQIFHFNLDNDRKGKEKEVSHFEEADFESIYLETHQLDAIPPHYAYSIKGEHFDKQALIVKVENLEKKEGNQMKEKEGGQTKKIIEITLMSQSNESAYPKQLTVIYDSFLNKAHYLHLMRWQLSLYQQIYC
ncbi:hypothetical protein [Candidatus Protochlamydia phocaeensis]|uniref:hypothetical protein n=1 Tax=Candidatus Protochlamydia phocaeensis TaxID=1414722 RepID=UPI000837BEDB|nr:hypothetical protein [Candidatus Protochlamydia phocaeensis]